MRLFATLKYRDARKAVEWLPQAFGLTAGPVFPETGETVDHAEMFAGEGGIMFGSYREGSPYPLGAGETETVGIYIVVDPAAIEAHYERAKAAGAEIVMDLYDTDYGSREYTARDFEGHLWSFGTYAPARP